jgi:hypothetical protein
MVIQLCMFSRESNAIRLFARSPHDRTVCTEMRNDASIQGILLYLTVIYSDMADPSSRAV